MNKPAEIHDIILCMVGGMRKQAADKRNYASKAAEQNVGSANEQLAGIASAIGANIGNASTVTRRGAGNTLSPDEVRKLVMARIAQRRSEQAEKAAESEQDAARAERRARHLNALKPVAQFGNALRDSRMAQLKQVGKWGR